MATPTKEELNSADRLRARLAVGLPYEQARLYSQFTLLGSGERGLQSWKRPEMAARLADAVELLDAAMLLRGAAAPPEEEHWRAAALRAGELFEWLSTPGLQPRSVPVRLLAAGAYQFAGYPARAAGLLSATESTRESALLAALLANDFSRLLRLLVAYWGTRAVRPREEAGNSLRDHVIDDAARSLGVLCVALRYGDRGRVERALANLRRHATPIGHASGYEWLVARLCADVAVEYLSTSLREIVKPLVAGLTPSGASAFEAYVRRAYATGRAIAWPSQARGAQRLAVGTSFALCTPTGSGKTAIAEMAVLQCLFEPQREDETDLPIALYLTPSRALAAEVEARFDTLMRGVTGGTVTVTGLYGGTDWGPTDAWLTSSDRAVVVCTYEKAEALLRHLGPLFMQRVGLVVVDEAHNVRAEANQTGPRRDWDSRPLRLESVITRMIAAAAPNARVVALSAVAAGFEDVLAQWVAADRNAKPAKSLYRSTRQLIGRLECHADRTFRIRYDLVDGQVLSADSADGELYIPRPFPQQPPVLMANDRTDGPEVYLRSRLLWVGAHLAARSADGRGNSVLMSVPQSPEQYAKMFLRLIGEWGDKLPKFFITPRTEEDTKLWVETLRSCADYFGKHSFEYRLLEEGVVVHHGKMPSSMGRALVRLIERRIVTLVLATSTLTEGVNLPFDTILVPSLRRASRTMSAREFANLAGRAGRPGVAVEGRTLVLVGQRQSDQPKIRTYERLIAALAAKQDDPVVRAISPLAELVSHINVNWRSLTLGAAASASFEGWLEAVAPLTQETTTASAVETLNAVDELDRLLLAVLVENERGAGQTLTPTERESVLQRTWRASFAHHAAADEAALARTFLMRGQAVAERIYPQGMQRQRLYMASLPPRTANALVSISPELRDLMLTGAVFADWTTTERVEYVDDLFGLVSSVKKFAPTRLPRRATRRDILRWWLARDVEPGTPTDVFKWYDFVRDNFIYRFAWGLTSAVAVILGEANDDQLTPTSLVDWPQTGLPWIVFWMKELINWGTLDPVVACLMGQGVVRTRSDADALAASYYASPEVRRLGANERLSASLVRDWVLERTARPTGRPTDSEGAVGVDLARDIPVEVSEWRVFPAISGGRANWLDCAGYTLATSNLPAGWNEAFVDLYDFTLFPRDRRVTWRVYQTQGT